MKRVLLIDGDILVFEASTSAETAIRWEEGLWTLHAFENDTEERFEKKVESIRSLLKPDHIIMTLTSGSNFRKTVYPLYKANRKDVRKPITWRPLREYVHRNYETFEREGLEGDDCLGILATRVHGLKDEERIVVSLDKDMRTIPGKHFNWNKPEQGVVSVTEDEADRMHMFQTLIGDTTDGYPGCPGVGPKKAEKVLDGCRSERERWEAVVEAYERAKLNEEIALQMARCARILRSTDYDFKERKPILWEPERGQK